MRKSSRETVEGWVASRAVDKEPNVVFVSPRETLSSYELIRRSKFVMVYNSTIGLEASILGAAVLSIIIFLPIIQPMANAAGLDPVHVDRGDHLMLARPLTHLAENVIASSAGRFRRSAAWSSHARSSRAGTEWLEHYFITLYLVPTPMLTAFVRTARRFAPARSRSMPSRTWRSLVC